MRWKSRQRRKLVYRQQQLLRCLEGQYGLTSKQIARRMNVTIPTARVYINSLLKSDLILVNFRELVKGSWVNHYAIKRKA